MHPWDDAPPFASYHTGEVVIPRYPQLDEPFPSVVELRKISTTREGEAAARAAVACRPKQPIKRVPVPTIDVSHFRASEDAPSSLSDIVTPPLTSPTSSPGCYFTLFPDILPTNRYIPPPIPPPPPSPTWFAATTSKLRRPGSSGGRMEATPQQKRSTRKTSRPSTAPSSTRSPPPFFATAPPVPPIPTTVTVTAPCQSTPRRELETPEPRPTPVANRKYIRSTDTLSTVDTPPCTADSSTGSLAFAPWYRPQARSQPRLATPSQHPSISPQTAAAPSKLAVRSAPPSPKLSPPPPLPLPAPTPAKEQFQYDQLPSLRQLHDASGLNVFGQDGKPVKFGSLFAKRTTVVCFIRHFYCPLCQDYMRSVVAEASVKALARAGVELVIIGNGSPSMIKAYKDKVFKSPFALYSDPSRAVYRALGMSLRTTDGGPEDEKGDYIKHGSLGGLGMVLKSALRMPLANAGDVKQLGGEFVLGPGLRCTFAHRMTTTRSHTPIQDVLAAAGVDLDPIPPRLRPFVDSVAEAEWMAERKRDWIAIRERRQERRAGCDFDTCTMTDYCGEWTGLGDLDPIAGGKWELVVPDEAGHEDSWT